MLSTFLIWKRVDRGILIMKKLIEKFETLMAAAAFAEEGEHETARQIMREEQPRKTDRPAERKRPSARQQLRAD